MQFTGKFELNSAAIRQIEQRLADGLEQYGDIAVYAAQGYVHKDTGSLAASIHHNGVQRDGGLMHLVITDGPGDRGRVYGAAEEVLRGGDHAFMRPAVDNTIGQLRQIVESEFSGSSMIGTGGAIAWPAPHGVWNPGPPRSYTF